MTTPGRPGFAATELTSRERALQQEVREFLAAEMPPGGRRPGLGMGAPADPEFSRKLGARGWLGMSLPREYGGGARGLVDRFVVTEELLRHGAPVGYHWTADRQSGPVINKFGTPEQKEFFLPAICRGEMGFSIGMSEPGAGSDLAAIRTSASKVDGGWVLEGTKIWTSGAHHNDWFIALVRTSTEQDRRAGLTQFLVDLRSPGVQINPIPILDGSADFNEVVLREVFVPDNRLLGEVGRGWAQNTAELAYERGGPERYLSTYVVVEQFLREAPAGTLGERAEIMLGRAAATWWVLRSLGLSIARSVDAGGSPVQEAALVKEMGTRFEQDVVLALGDLLEIEPSPEDDSLLQQLFSDAVLTSPIFTIRGGTVEVLRSVVAKGLGR